MSLIVDHLYLSNVSTSRSHKFFKKQKITHVLIAAHNLKKIFQEVTYKKFHIIDNPKQNIAKHFVEAIQFTYETISAKKNILIHCLGGKSRSVTLVTAYIMLTNNLSFEKALELVKNQHYPAKPNPGFIRQLRLFEECVKQYYREVSPDQKKGYDFALLEKIVSQHFGLKVSEKKKQNEMQKNIQVLECDLFNGDVNKKDSKIEVLIIEQNKDSAQDDIPDLICKEEEKENLNEIINSEELNYKNTFVQEQLTAVQLAISDISICKEETEKGVEAFDVITINTTQ